MRCRCPLAPVSHYIVGWGKSDGVIRAFLVVLCGSLVCCVGCGQKSPKRFRVQGAITYEGKAVPQGTISFSATKGGLKYSGYAGIVNGRFDSLLDGQGHIGGEQTIVVIGGDAPTASSDGGEAFVSSTIGPIEWTEVFPASSVTLRLTLPR